MVLVLIALTGIKLPSFLPALFTLSDQVILKHPLVTGPATGLFGPQREPLGTGMCIWSKMEPGAGRGRESKGSGRLGFFWGMGGMTMDKCNSGT